MTHVTLPHRLARRDDLDALRALMDAAISELQKPFYEPCERLMDDRGGVAVPRLPRALPERVVGQCSRMTTFRG